MRLACESKIGQASVQWTSSAQWTRFSAVDTLQRSGQASAQWTSFSVVDKHQLSGQASAQWTSISSVDMLQCSGQASAQSYAVVVSAAAKGTSMVNYDTSSVQINTV